MNETKQPGKIYLDEYKTALVGEICALIGHNPDSDESTKMEQYAADYVADCLNDDKTPTLSGVCAALSECLSAEFSQCSECGEWFLVDEMNKETLENYCLSCKPYYDPDWFEDCIKK